MRAQVLRRPAAADRRPLVLEERDRPEPGPGSVRVHVHASACCRTDLHVIEGDLELPKLPIIPGHQVVGVVEELGPGCTRLAIGDRIGVAWLHETALPKAIARPGMVGAAAAENDLEVANAPLRDKSMDRPRAEDQP